MAFPQSVLKHLTAFFAVVGTDLDGYEIDLHTTRDGKRVANHADASDKMTDERGNVEALTFDKAL